MDSPLRDMKKILCFFGYHDNGRREEVVIKTKKLETVNVYPKCGRCGHEGEAYGYTHFGPFTVTLDK